MKSAAWTLSFLIPRFAAQSSSMAQNLMIVITPNGLSSRQRIVQSIHFVHAPLRILNITSMAVVLKKMVSIQLCVVRRQMLIKMVSISSHVVHWSNFLHVTNQNQMLMNWYSNLLAAKKLSSMKNYGISSVPPAANSH